MRIIRTLCFWTAACCLPVTTFSAPVLTLEHGDGSTGIWVEVTLHDGSSVRNLLRETTATVTPGHAGGDPAGNAAFVTWTEDDSETWSSHSRDGGRTWSDSRPLETSLRMHTGPVQPNRKMPQPGSNLALPEEGRLFIAQFRTVSLPEWRDALRDAGADVIRFFPDNAHIISIDRSLATDIRSLDFVERLEPYHPAYRIGPDLLAWLDSDTTSAGGEGEEIRVRVMAFEWGPGGKARIAEAGERLGARVAEYWPSGHILEMWTNREQLRALAGLDDVMWIDRWTPPENDMDLVRQDAGTDWVEDNHGYCGQGVRGEVMDGGIQGDHPDFDGIIFHGNYNYDSHGTSTYGIVFGNGDRDGDGQAQGTGHMPCEGAQGIFADYGSYGGDRFAHTEELKGSPYFASFQTNSWGGGRTTVYTSTSSQMDDIIWRLDIAITQSQSNAGNRSSRPEAWAKNIISVGGIRHYNTLDTADDAWSYGASIGPAQDGRIKPDINYWYDSIYTTTGGGGYTSSFGGTSAATPESAGVLGLMVQMWSDNVWNTNPVGDTVFERQPHASTIKALLINNAQQYDFTGTTHDLTRVHQGWGRPSAKLAYERAAWSLVIDQLIVLELNDKTSFEIQVPEGETELKATMVYPDPPGTTSSTMHRINDVNLKVVSPSGDTYHGNYGLDAGNYSLAGGSPNNIDTVENVFIENPEAGTWIVEVEAVEINQDAYLDTPGDDLVFSLVVTGGSASGICGNGENEFDELCDGADLGGITCQDLGCTGGGTLACSVDCTFDLSGCFDCPVCDDGACNFGETCLSCSADCISESSATCGNGLCETVDGEDCVSCPQDCAGVQTGKPDSRYCCGDGDGTNPVTCFDSRCNSGGFICSDEPSLAYCCGDGVCEGPEDISSCEIDCTPPSAGENGTEQSGQLVVTAYDRANDILSIDYGVGCDVTDGTIEYGELTAANLASYNWSGQVCNIGGTGVYDWAAAGTPESIFFVVVGHNATGAGSYGTDSTGFERTEDTTGLDCPVAQNLLYRCD